MKMKTFVLTLFSRTHAYDAFIKALIMHNGCRQKKKKKNAKSELQKYTTRRYK